MSYLVLNAGGLVLPLEVTDAPVNAPPVITSSPATTGAEGTQYTYTVTATDPGDTLTFSLPTKPAGMLIDSVSGVITWIPSSAGSESVTVRVTDSGGLYDEQSFSITVSAAVNYTPNITSAAVTTANVDALYSYTVTATDPGDTLTFSLPTKPVGMTINSTTGLIQWTPTATGSAAVVVRVTDSGGLYDEQSFSITVDAFTGIDITTEWLAARTAPYRLTTQAKTYRLQTDVTVDGTAFIVAARDVTINLNGHTITYGNAAPITVPNGGFETGSGTTVPNWNLTNAPHAAIAANDIYAWGDQVLKFTNIIANEWIVSDPISIPTPDREYVATCTPKGPYDLSCTLYVKDATTGTTLGSNTITTERGFSAVVSFTPTAATTAVVLEILMDPAAGKTQTVYLDDVTLTHGRDHAVVASGNSSSYWPTHLRPVASTLGRNTVIRNGTLVQGQSNGFRQHAIWATATKQSFTAEDLTIHVTGIDTKAIYTNQDSFYGAGTANINRNTVTAAITKITDRMYWGSMIAIGSTVVNATYNSVSDHPQIGIQVGGGTGNLIANNTIDSNAIATNCYGIFLEVQTNAVIRDNTIVTTRSGRGIMIDCLTGHSADTVGVEITGNVIDIREKPNLEFGYTGIEATALRLRSYRDGGYRQLNIHDNSFTAQTDVGFSHGAIGLRMSGYNTLPVVDWQNVLRNNTFKAIVNTTDTDYWARAVTLEGMSEDILTKFYDNVFESNHICLGLGGNDGSAAYDTLFQSTEFRKSLDGAARTHMSLYAGELNGTSRGIQIIDATYTGGATDVFAYTGTGTKTIEVGWLLSVDISDGASGLPNIAASILDIDGVEVTFGVSNATGLVEDLLVVEEIITVVGTGTPSINTRTPHSVSIAATGFAAYIASETVDQTKTHYAELTGV